MDYYAKTFRGVWSNVCWWTMIGLGPGIIKSKIYRNFVNNTRTTSHMLKFLIVLKETQTITMINPLGIYVVTFVKVSWNNLIFLLWIYLKFN